jgi:hypothetical protein
LRIEPSEAPLRTVLTVSLFHFDSLQINRIHHRTLKKLDSCKVALDQTFKFQVGRFPVQKDNFNVDIFAVFVEKVLEKVADTLVSYVATNNNVSARGD